MSDQEMVLKDLPGVSKVFVVGHVEPSRTKGHVMLYDHHHPPMTGLAGLSSGVDEDFPYSGYINYMVHLQELGIDVVKVDSIDYLGYALASAYNRSIHAPRPDRIVKRQMVSVSPQANAYKALFPDLKLSAAACESLALNAGLTVKMDWLDQLREARGGELLIKDVVDRFPGVGRATIKNIFGV